MATNDHGMPHKRLTVKDLNLVLVAFPRATLEDNHGVVAKDTMAVSTLPGADPASLLAVKLILAFGSPLEIRADGVERRDQRQK